MGIEGIGSIGQLEAAQGQIQQQQGDEAASTGPAEAFQNHLQSGLESVNSQVREADMAAKEMVKTQGANMHETMVELSKADLATKMSTKIGQKLVQAYKEVSRIKV
jgi:flagellar hook-basal body complex protein FliE